MILPPTSTVPVKFTVPVENVLLPVNVWLTSRPARVCEPAGNVALVMPANVSVAAKAPDIVNGPAVDRLPPRLAEKPLEYGVQIRLEVLSVPNSTQLTPSG